jgi:hypothetical protein
MGLHRGRRQRPVPPRAGAASVSGRPFLDVADAWPLAHRPNRTAREGVGANQRRSGRGDNRVAEAHITRPERSPPRAIRVYQIEASRVLVCEDHRPTANYAGRAID